MVGWREQLQEEDHRLSTNRQPDGGYQAFKQWNLLNRPVGEDGVVQAPKDTMIILNKRWSEMDDAQKETAGHEAAKFLKERGTAVGGGGVSKVTAEMGIHRPETGQVRGLFAPYDGNFFMSPPPQNPPAATTPLVDGESREDGRSRSTSPRPRANSFAPDNHQWRQDHGWTEGEWKARTKRKMDHSVAEDAMNVLVHSHRVRKTLKPLVGATLYTMEAQWYDKNTNKLKLVKPRQEGERRSGRAERQSDKEESADGGGTERAEAPLLGEVGSRVGEVGEVGRSERSARRDRVSERSARWDRVSEGSAGR